MIKSTFRVGINSPIKLALLDRRLSNPQDAIFGVVQGNLAYGKMVFSCNPQIGVPLNTKNINSVICLAHEFERSDLMKSGDMPFRITYKIGYSLTNNHHSMMFKSGDKISIEGVFKEIGQTSSIPFQEVPPLDSVWAMDLPPKPFLGAQPNLRIIEKPRTALGIRNSLKTIRDTEPSTSQIDEDESPTIINQWTYNPNWNNEPVEDRAFLRAQHRMSGLPPPREVDSARTISQRINRLSIDLS